MSRRPSREQSIKKLFRCRTIEGEDVVPRKFVAYAWHPAPHAETISAIQDIKLCAVKGSQVSTDVDVCNPTFDCFFRIVFYQVRADGHLHYYVIVTDGESYLWVDEGPGVNGLPKKGIFEGGTIINLPDELTGRDQLQIHEKIHKFLKQAAI